MRIQRTIMIFTLLLLIFSICSSRPDTAGASSSAKAPDGLPYLERRP